MGDSEPLRVAVIGAGLIGIELVARIRRSPHLECCLLAGRDGQARGLRVAQALGCPVAADGIESVTADPNPFDLVFDASNAVAHPGHWARLAPLGTKVIDLTPSMVGHMVVPAVNGAEALAHPNLNLVSCGGQASIPLLHALAGHYPLSYIEVVTTAASASVGRATRLNLDEYIETTQRAIQSFTGVGDVKAMVNLSPARPPATFRVAVSAVAHGLEPGPVRELAEAAAERMRGFVPGFEIAACTVRDDTVFIAAQISSTGDHIPRYAGNLDIINSAAMFLAEQYAASRDLAFSAGSPDE
jgi:acetaldehyde dehydrogenase